MFSKKHINNPFFAFLIIFISFCYSCGDKQNNIQKTATGKPGEIIVVMDKNAWNSEPGKELRKILSALQPGLPQDEPIFRLYQVPVDSFSSFFKTYLNILFVKCNSGDSGAINTKHDVWATSQAYMEISAKNTDALTNILNNNQKKILDFFINEEKKRLQELYASYQEKDFNKILAAHHISLIIPKGFKLDADTAGFVKITSEMPNTIQGILIYEFPFNGRFTPEKIITVRDSVLKIFVLGQLPGSWMTTEHDFAPVASEINLNNVQVFELRGLWKMQNALLGGPFISLSFVDKKRNKIITVEGYVYAPKSEKLNYIRQMEAILYSVKLI